MMDGVLLGKAIEEAAFRYKSPMAIPLMDLKIEKQFLLEILGIERSKVDSYHFEGRPGGDLISKVKNGISKASTPRMEATCKAIKYIAENTKLLPVGMCIGPFSFMTKLMADPITAVYMYGMGISPEDDESVGAVNDCLDLALIILQEYLGRQISAGAKAIMMCEPAANKIYISPKQIEEGSDIFEKTVMKNLRKIKEFLDSKGVDLMLHDCGELTNEMVCSFGTLNPAVLSLGSSRTLWEDAKLLPKDVILYGNLPSKHFYSDEKITEEQVKILSAELIKKMKKAGHPFILGSECDVLNVPEFSGKIRAKVNAFMSCSCCK